MKDSRRRLSLAAIIASNGMAAAAYGLLQPVLSIRLQQSGSSSLVIGIVASIWSLGIVAGSPYYARIIHRLGALPSLVVGLLTTGTLIVLFPFVHDAVAWAFFQFLQGLAFGHFWVLSEAWINSMACARSRGRTIAVYVTVLGLGASLGPLLVNLVGEAGALPFVTCSALLLLGSAPLFLLRGIEPEREETAPPPVRKVIRTLPLLVIVGLVAGFADHAPQGMLPAFALAQGSSVHRLALMLFALGAGRALFVVPIGMLADRFSVTRVLATCSLISVGLIWALLMAWGQASLVYATLFVLGASFDAFYALGVALIGTRFANHELAAANTVFVVLHSLGGFGGSVLVGGAMDVAGPIGYVASIAAVVLLLPLSLGLAQLRAGRFGRSQRAGG